MKVVLLHAFPLDERMWDQQRKVLAGHEVVAPNLYDLGGNSIDTWAGRILAKTPGISPPSARRWVVTWGSRWPERRPTASERSCSPDRGRARIRPSDGRLAKR